MPACEPVGLSDAGASREPFPAAGLAVARRPVLLVSGKGVEMEDVFAVVVVDLW